MVGTPRKSYISHDCFDHRTKFIEVTSRISYVRMEIIQTYIKRTLYVRLSAGKLSGIFGKFIGNL